MHLTWHPHMVPNMILYLLSNIRRSHILCLKRSYYILNNDDFNNQHDYWAVYVANMCCFLSDKKLLLIEKSINCKLSLPSLQAIVNYNKLVKKSEIKEDLCYNDFYSVTKYLNTNVLRHVSF